MIPNDALPRLIQGSASIHKVNSPEPERERVKSKNLERKKKERRRKTGECETRQEGPPGLTARLGRVSAQRGLANDNIESKLLPGSIPPSLLVLRVAQDPGALFFFCSFRSCFLTKLIDRRYHRPTNYCCWPLFIDIFIAY